MDGGRGDVPPDLDAQRRLREAGEGTPTETTSDTDTVHTGSSGGKELGEIVVESNDTSNDTHSAASAASAAAPSIAAPADTAAAATTVKVDENDGRGVHSSTGSTFQLNPSKPCFVSVTSTERTDRRIPQKCLT